MCTKQRLKCLARGHNAVSLVILESQSRVKHVHSTTGILLIFINNGMYTIMIHLIDHVRLIKLHKQNRYNLCVSKKECKDQESINQAPHLNQGTNGKVTTSQLDITNESQEVSPFPAGDHKASINRRVRKHNKNKTEIT